MTTAENKTHVGKSIHNGWGAETLVTISGTDYQVRTGKRSNGTLSTSAQKGERKGNSFTFIMFADENITILSEKAMCNEKNVRDQHSRALVRFAEMKAGEADKPVYKIEIGQIVFTDMIQYDSQQRRAVYEITPEKDYKTVLLDGSMTQHDSHIRNIKEKFGIGVYYNEGEKISHEELNALLVKARENMATRADQVKKEKQAAADQRINDIAKGKSMITIPADAAAVIVARHKVDKSEPMSDYFHHEVDQVIYLAYSTHTKDMFPEMRKAAAKFPQTAHLETIGAEAENRSRHTGSSTYLGEHWNYGWEIAKNNLTPGASYGTSYDDLYIAAAQGRYLCDQRTTPSVIDSDIETEQNGLVLFKYSEKAFVVTGNTKPIKDQLSSMGGRFNARLTNPSNNEKFMGWIFSNKKLDEVKNALCIETTITA